jgi:hypothetical protein
VTPTRFFSLVTENALSRGRPLDEALLDAARQARYAPAPLRRAVEELRAGHLSQALAILTRVGLPPLFAEAASLRPQAAGAVRERLDRIPLVGALTMRLREVATLVILVLLTECSSGAILSKKIVPTLSQIHPTAGLHLLASSYQLAFVALFLAIGLGLYGTPLLLRNSVRALRSAAVHAAAAGLAASGGADEARRLLVSHQKTIGSSPARSLSAASLDEIAAQLCRLADQRATRRLVVIKVAGTGVALGIAVVLAGSVYAWLPLLSQVPVP